MRLLPALLIFTNMLLANPCTDPYYTVEIDGITYSGSTATAFEAYKEDEKKVKELLFASPQMDNKEKERLLQWYFDDMAHLAKFWGKCSEHGKSKQITSP